MAHKTLTFAERLILSNQFTILEKLDPDQAEYYSEAQEIVNRGYEYLYEEINPSVYETAVPHDVGKEVVDILDMFRALEFSCRDLSISARSLRVDFDGFDGNSNTGHFSLAKFFRRNKGNWDELKEYPDNSHSSGTLDRYRSMLDRWEKLDRKFELSEEEITEIAG